MYNEKCLKINENKFAQFSFGTCKLLPHSRKRDKTNEINWLILPLMYNVLPLI